MMTSRPSSIFGPGTVAEEIVLRPCEANAFPPNISSAQQRRSQINPCFMSNDLDNPTP